MGGYGHSRLREFVLGGVTREILTSMTVPTLMSHWTSRRAHFAPYGHSLRYIIGIFIKPGRGYRSGMRHGLRGTGLFRLAAALPACFSRPVRGDNPAWIFRNPPGNSRMITRLAGLLLLLGISVGFAEENEPSALERHGQALAETMCSQCHAVGKSGQSPHAGAPPFRALDRRVDIDTFFDRLREGLMVGHPDMPTFRFKREDARGFVLYLRSIQAP
jgi:mono/diheme cytochrome c family protein